MQTKFKSSADFRKSLETRLQSMASSSHIDLQRLRRTVAFDRLLARLFLPDQTAFVLKGGYAMELRINNARATKDIDLTFLHRLQTGELEFRDLILHELRSIAQQDLGDFFTYQIEEARLDLDNAPYGGARYPVSSFIDGKLFVRFHLDVGGDALIYEKDTIKGKDWLGFCGIAPPYLSMISVEQQFAEKIHAYTLPRNDRKNTRVKDLIDLVLLADIRDIRPSRLKAALKKIFRVRNTHDLPSHLHEPPDAWEKPFHALAEDCGIDASIQKAFSVVTSIYDEAFAADD